MGTGWVTYRQGGEYKALRSLVVGMAEGQAFVLLVQRAERGC